MVRHRYLPLFCKLFCLKDRALQRLFNRKLMDGQRTSPMVFFLRYFLFWVLVFFVQRLAFVGYFFERLHEAGNTAVLQTFFYGIRLDLSMAGYFSALPFVVFVVQSFINRTFFNAALKVYTIVLLLLTVLISGGDLGIYESWGVKLNFRAVSMLLHPAEAMETSKSAPVFLLLLMMLAELLAALGLYRLIVAKIRIPVAESRYRYKWSYWIQLPLIAACVFLSIRGGWQQIPINESAAYFSHQPVANHAAVNTSWHLMSSILTNLQRGNTNRYTYLPATEATKMITRLYHKAEPDSSIQILNQQRPNIIFIQLESFTADVVQELGGDSLVTPNISRLINEGVLFTDIFSSGVRTDQGIIALLSGFPAQPQTSIVYQPEKLENLPFISQVLKKENYFNTFYYGGELGFGRFNSIAYRAGFDRIVGLRDFKDAALFNKWGADDQSLLEKYVAEMNEPAQPFFSYIITSSSHEPFTVPMPTVIAGDSPGAQFKNACYFTDQSLGRFLNAVKHKDWYKNTLFVLVADHGHSLPRNRRFNEPERYHIPLILFGDVLKDDFRGKKIAGIGSQTDVAATLLNQLQIKDTAFKWSNDLLNPHRKPFAFYTFDDGFGWLTQTDTLLFDNRAKQVMPVANRETHQQPDSSLTTGKAYMQMLYSAFLRF